MESLQRRVDTVVDKESENETQRGVETLFQQISKVEGL